MSEVFTCIYFVGGTAGLAELVAQNPLCFYRMVGACIRRHAANQDTCRLKQDARLFMIPHPSTAVAGSKEGGAAALGSSCYEQPLDQEQISMSIISSSGKGVLSNWKQTQAFLSAVLSYRKALLLLRDSLPSSELQGMDFGLHRVLGWLIQEGELQEAGAAAAEEGQQQQQHGSSSSNSGSVGEPATAAAAGGEGEVGSWKAGTNASAGRASCSTLDAAASGCSSLCRSSSRP